MRMKYKVDKKAMIRNRYNRSPHPDLNIKQERDTYTVQILWRNENLIWFLYTGEGQKAETSNYVKLKPV